MTIYHLIQESFFDVFQQNKKYILLPLFLASVTITSIFSLLFFFSSSYFPHEEIVGILTIVLFIMSLYYLMYPLHLFYSNFTNERVCEKIMTSLVDVGEMKSPSIVHGIGYNIKKSMWLFFLFILALPFPIINIVVLSVITSINFLDFPWSREEKNFSEYKEQYKNNFWVYTGIGFFIAVLSLIPLVNIFVPVYATCLYTRLHFHLNHVIIK
jgi:uncharacterized protein involved in cysteine biosynthesis